MQGPFLNVGISKDTVKEIRKSIVAILKTKADQATKQVALTALKELSQITGVNITSCVFKSK